MRFSYEQVQRFSAWSGDRNPLHIDEEFARQAHFGRPIVHGVLTALEAFRAALPDAAHRPVQTLDIEFRSAAVVGEDYEARWERDGEVLVVSLGRAGQFVVSARVEVGELAEPISDGFWLQPESTAPSLREIPAEHTIPEFERGVAVSGRYPILADGAPVDALLSPLQVRVLALCSYITGMELPGLKALFTRISVRFHATEDTTSELWYRARTTRFDRHFRLLDTDLQVVTPSGRVLATALLRSYVPFSPAYPNVSELTSTITPDVSVHDKVAAVIGGSRGLGAEIAAGLAVSGWQVYASSRQDDAREQSWTQELKARGGRLEFLQGDARDPAWCEATRQMIRARHARLDLLVLNACAPPSALRFGTAAAARHAQYVRENLELVETPLAAFADTLEESAGRIVCISSSFVQDPPAGFSHYVTVKQAAEGLVRTVCRERPRTSALIVRPPVLQTRWNDTPAGIVGAIPSQRVASHIVNSVSRAAEPGDVALLSEFPPVDSVAPAVARSDIPADFSIRIAASFTVDPLLPAMGFWAKELELDARIEAAPYGQVLQSLLDPTSLLNAKSRGVNIVLLRVRDWLRELTAEQAGDIEFVRQYLQDTARDFERALRAHRARAASQTLLFLCPSYGALSAAESILLRQAETDIVASTAGVPGVEAVFASEYHAHYSVNEDQIHDELRDEIAHIPYRDEYLCVLATVAARHIHRRLSPTRKVVVVDCDNTLWRGVVGEVGAEGVELDDGHRALHGTLERLAQSGVLVCLCSKNEEADVWRVFDTRSDLLLRREDIVAAVINWRPKSEGIRTLASRLNLGLDSFVFIDDNPVECAEMRAGCPEVLTIEWPQDPERATRLLQHVWELDPRAATKEDEQRTELYRQEFRRQAARADTLTFEDFINNLQLVVDFAPLDPADLRRAAQLTLRTNQFNFTTIRRDEADVQALSASGRHELRTVRVRDRFGDYGLVGLVIAERGTDVWAVDTLLLSCRVLGRGVEHRVIAELGRIAADAGARTVKLRVEMTQRNTPAQSFVDSIIPAAYKHADERAIDCEVPVDVLAAIRFEPATAAEVATEDPDAGAAATQPVDVGRLRAREAQITRVAFDLATGSELRAAIEGRRAPSTAGDVPQESDIAAVVLTAFATALRIPPERVAEIDQLEPLGCDSLRIVEITVALSEKFPWLPSTLLFEHRSVSQIVKEIGHLATRPELPAAVATNTSLTPSPSAQTEAPRSTDIAVVGMHVRCAGVNSPDDLWDLLSAGRSAVKPVPAERRHFLQRLFDSRSHWAGLIDEPAQFDAEFFGVSPREAEFMDPQLRLFLEVAWNALEDAGCAGADHDANTGVYAGVMYGDYGVRANVGSNGAPNPYRCWEGFSLANRLSQLLGFHGPSLAVDTACSSSGTALHLACAALNAGECTVAVVGGVNLILDPDRFVSLGRLGILSTRGRCEPFGSEADGTVLGEGAGVVILRPIDEALRRGDRIYGVIKGTGLSTGSGTVGFTAPNPQAQAEAVRRALKAARVDPRTISYVETHGTGTALGDPIEVRGLTLGYDSPDLHDPAVRITHRATIGSIKPNIGHLEAGAGVLGLIKVLLQLHRGQLVPSITSPQPNPQIAFADGPFDVQRGLTEWQRLAIEVNGTTRSVPRRAGLSSFGVGGANAHVIIEEAPEPKPAEVPSDRPLHVLAVAAPHERALQQQVAELRDYFEHTSTVSASDACYSVNTGRKHFRQRLTLTATDRDDLLRALGVVSRGGEPRGSTRSVVASGSSPKVAFLFTGQGSQYAGMGRQLYESQPVFRHALDRCAAIFDTLLNRPLLDLLFAAEGSEEAELLNQTGYTQPALFAFEYALSELWRSWGVRPDVVLGHSVGEIAAMCVAGGVTLEDGLKLIAARGRLMQALPAGGVMTSVMADERRVSEAIAGCEDSVAIAAINAPGQVVISGAGTAVAEIAARLSADGIKTKSLTVSHAFHSPLMRPMLAEYERVVRGIRFSPPRVPFVSCVDGMLASDEATRVEYWLRNVIEPVRFAAGVRALEAQQVSAYLEVGPHPVLLGMARQCVSDDSAVAWLPSLRKDSDAWQTILSSVADLYARGVEVDWKGFDQPYARRRATVPTYRFTRKDYWLRQVPALGSKTSSSDDPPVDSAEACLYEVAWRSAPHPDLAARGATPSAFERRCIPPGGVAPPSNIPDILGRRALPDGRLAVLGATMELHHGLLRASATAVKKARATGESNETRHWIIFADQSGVGGELATRLSDMGRATTVIPPGDRNFARVWRDATSKQAAAVPCVVYLCALDASPAELLNTSAVEHEIDQIATATMQLMQAVATAGAPEAKLWIVTRGAVRAETHPSEPVVLTTTPLWGLGRTFALEYPAHWGGLIDVSLEDVSAAARALAAELLSEDGEDQVSISAGGRHVARLVRSTAKPSAPIALSGEGTYLVTGGAGALGLHVARWLVANGARRLVLASRRGVLNDRGKSVVSALQKLGASVSVVAADVSRVEDVDQLIASVSKDTPLRGIVHAAGVDRTVPLHAITTADLRAALGAKAIGAWLLHERTRTLELDCFICFSSMSSVLGAQGRAHYSAANAFLDALAIERRRLGLPAATINWGPWLGGGMASPGDLQQFERAGNRGLEPDWAIEALGSVMARGDVQTMVANIDWEIFGPVYEARRRRPIVSELTKSRQSAEATTASAVAPWIDRLRTVRSDERVSELAALLRTEIADTLGFDSPESVPIDRTFYEIGMDSLMMADLVSRLTKRLGVSCTALVFNHPDVRSLADRMLERLPLDIEAAPPAIAESAATIGEHRATNYDSSIEADILAFQTNAFPDRRADWVAPRWRWMFINSAARLGVSPRFWVHRDNGAIVGQMGSIPVLVKIGDEQLNTGWLVETMVLKDYRTQAVGSRLMVEAHEDQPFSLSLGQTAEMREIQFRLGWRQVAALQTAQLLVRPGNVLKGKIPTPAAWAADVGLRASSALRDLLGHRSTYSATAIECFGRRHDALWAEASRDLPCAVVRDASYLNWKYVDQPGQDFLRLEISDGRDLKGVVIWMLRDADDIYRYRRAFLVDVVAPLSDTMTLQQIVKAACGAAADRGVDALVCHHVNKRLTQALGASGFHLRRPERFFLVDPGSLSGSRLDCVLAADNWLVTQGDSDIDRPW